MKSEFNIRGRRFVCSHDQSVEVDFTLAEEKDGVYVYKIKFDFGEARLPEKISLSWQREATGVYSVWDPARRDRHIGYGGNEKFRARLASWMPLVQTVSKNGKNCALTAVMDVKTPVSIGVKMLLEQETAETELVFFDDITNPMTGYETLIREDLREIPFDEAVMQAAEWCSPSGGDISAPPEAALMPMYSTWYSYLQKITAEDVIKECTEAVKYGMKSVIIDDGWQTNDSGALYGYTGDWKPVSLKFDDMRALSDRLHELGMKVILWFSVPFVGYYSENYKKFETMYLRNNDNINCSTLDPRYKEVRDFLIQTYVNAVKEWDLDGLKLDFIDRFYSDGKVNEKMDYVSVEDATEQLLKEITAALKRVKPDIMIEFRQPYIGPVITEYGNMVRVWDCPLDPLSNRLGTLNLRLTSGKCAVHSDMINWGREDTPQSVASRLISSLFSVPQISVRLNEITGGQKLALKTYLDCRIKLGGIIENGRLKLSDPESGYSAAQATFESKTVAVGFCKNVFDLDKCSEAVVFNLTSEQSIIVQNAAFSQYTVYDCMGNVTDSGGINESLASVPVPFAGRAEIFRKN